MYEKTAFLLFAMLPLVQMRVLDEDMMLYWRRSNSDPCKPFTTFQMDCNKCVCSADRTAYCTRMDCKGRGHKFYRDDSEDY